MIVLDVYADIQHTIETIDNNTNFISDISDLNTAKINLPVSLDEILNKIEKQYILNALNTTEGKQKKQQSY